MTNAALLGENNRRGSQAPEVSEILWINGGIHAMQGNPAGARGLADYLGRGSPDSGCWLDYGAPHRPAAVASESGSGAA